MPYAHSKNHLGQRQDLVDHLARVAELAATFAAPFSAHDVACVAGLLHDIGKFNPAWQRYLLDAEARVTPKPRGPDHKGAGACWGERLSSAPVAFMIQGHHGGLTSLADLKSWMRERAADPTTRLSFDLANQALPALTALTAPPLPAYAQRDELAIELFMRFTFSALVDADFLDTERHFTPAALASRRGSVVLPTLWRQFEANQATLTGRHSDSVNSVRHAVYQDCLAASELAPGFFRLTVPTGGGKTRSSLAFALRHALRHDLRRVVYAIPYTSIIEQTASVFRAIFSDSRAVLEHHSALASPEDAANPQPAEIWSRLAAENWDAPLIVTTTVQLFESLLAKQPGACRKLHNLARSVIILDEAQMLPTHLLTTILDVLRALVADYGVTVVLCTATQPALDERGGFAGLPSVREIVNEPERHFHQLARVAYEWPAARERWSWARVSDELRGAPQALAIVNTRADALALLASLDDDADEDINGDRRALHLSTRLCGAHRRAVLEDVRARLASGAPCRLVATQVVEAGVDVDFPLVLRALGPLDRIVQAAGRCNREGRIAAGRVVIFDPEDGGLPPGAYRVGTQLTQTLARGGEAALHDPALYTRYFEDYYQHVNLDEQRVQSARHALDYPATAERFRMIADETAPVVVRYGGAKQEELIETALADLRAQRGSPRELLRTLQPFIVGLRPRELAQAQRQGLAVEVMPGLWEWLGAYDSARGTGIVLDGPVDPERTIW